MPEADLTAYDCEKNAGEHSPHPLTMSKESRSLAHWEAFLDASNSTRLGTLESKDNGGGERVNADVKLAPSEQMVNISLPTISRLIDRIQHAQSSMGKFGDVALFVSIVFSSFHHPPHEVRTKENMLILLWSLLRITLALQGLAHFLASYALLLFFTDEFSKYHTIIIAELRSRRLGLYDTSERFYLSSIQYRVTSFTQTSILCGAYTALDALFVRFFFPKSGLSRSINVFEVLVPLGFGIITQLCACEMFFEWWRDPKRPEYGVIITTGGVRSEAFVEEEEASFVVIVTIFLLVWFLYFRVRPLLQR